MKKSKNMTVRNIVLLLLTIVILPMLLSSCKKKNPANDILMDAVYTEDTSFGTVGKKIHVVVTVQEKSVDFTLMTEQDTLGEALIEYDLISGDQTEYGLYVKTVNGITADYDTDQSYWAFYKDGEYLMTGVDTTEIEDGDHYEIVYTK